MVMVMGPTGLEVSRPTGFGEAIGAEAGATVGVVSVLGVISNELYRLWPVL
jgi:hypothetical protein